MSESPTVEAYKVSYTQYVRDALRDLLTRAKAAGRGKDFLQAAKKIAARLQVYPQFGEPIMALTHPPGQMWIGTIEPLVIRYALYEDLRLVIVAVPLMHLPNSGL